MTAGLPVMRIVVLSGRVAVGKTTLAEGLVAELDATVLKTRKLLEARGAGSGGRVGLQELGRRLDEATGGGWVADELKALDESKPVVVVDAARLPGQLSAMAGLGQTLQIHLVAPLPVLAERHRRTHPEDPSYEVVSSDPTERGVEAMAATADLVIDTAAHDISETRAMAVAFVRAGRSSRSA